VRDTEFCSVAADSTRCTKLSKRVHHITFVLHFLHAIPVLHQSPCKPALGTSVPVCHVSREQRAADGVLPPVRMTSYIHNMQL
jgi:hypothetical protein